MDGGDGDRLNEIVAHATLKKRSFESLDHRRLDTLECAVGEAECDGFFVSIAQSKCVPQQKHATRGVGEQTNGIDTPGVLEYTIHGQ